MTMYERFKNDEKSIREALAFMEKEYREDQGALSKAGAGLAVLMTYIPLTLVKVGLALCVLLGRA